MKCQDYIQYRRDLYPHTKYFIEQWDSIYDFYECERCHCMQPNMKGMTAPRQILHTRDRYTACLNVPIQSKQYLYKLHFCNILPVIIGSRLDRRIRNVDYIPANEYGTVLMYYNNWVFNSFLNTNSRLCHVYREHNASTSVLARVYLYDSTNHGNMLYIDFVTGVVTVRDYHHREFCIGWLVMNTAVDKTDKNSYELFNNQVLVFNPKIDDEPNEILDLFVKDCGYNILYENAAEYEATQKEQFSIRREFFYSLTVYLITVKNMNLDIDDLSNKRLFSAPGLYALMLQTFVNVIRQLFVDYNDTEAIIRIERLAIHTKEMSHRANLTSLISRKVCLKKEFGETMKRLLKKEMRTTNMDNTKHYAAPPIITGSTSAWSIKTDIEREKRVSFLLTDGNTVYDSNEYQFFCGRICSDVEYVYEQVKRLKIINHALRCLLMPQGYERFLSCYNIGNISTVGRVMNRTHSMMESFFVHTEKLVRVIVFICTILLSNNKNNNSHINSQNCILNVNEIPVIGVRVTTHMFWPLFVLLKSLFPGIQIVRSSNIVINITVNNGICLIPVTVLSANEKEQRQRDREIAVNDPSFAEYCHQCKDYRPYDTTSIFEFPNWIFVIIRSIRSVVAHRVDPEILAAIEKMHVLRKCTKHIWCSRREIMNYSQDFPEEAKIFDLYYYHEVACHGLLSCGSFVSLTQNSKIIVSINAHRRQILFRDMIQAPSREPIPRHFAQHMIDQNSRYNMMRLLQCEDDDSQKMTINHNNHTVLLFYIFSDWKMLNCEDGYVMDENLPIAAETHMTRKIGFISESRVFYFSEMRFIAMEPYGLLLHIGTFSSYSPISFSRSSNFVVSMRYGKESVNRTTFDFNNNTQRGDNEHENMDHHESIILYEYDLSFILSSSYIQGISNMSYIPTRRIANNHNRGNDTRESMCSRLIYETLTTNTSSSSLKRKLNKQRDESKKMKLDENIASETDENNNNNNVSENNIFQSNKSDLYTEICEYGDKFAVQFILCRKNVKLNLFFSKNKQTYKVQNSFGQKGLAQYADLSDLVTESGGRVRIISSMYSFIGRSAVAQLMEQCSDGGKGTLKDYLNLTSGPEKVYSRSTGKLLGYGGYGQFFFSNDSAHTNFMFSSFGTGDNPLRLCRLTHECMLENNLSTMAFVKSTEFENGQNNPLSGPIRSIVSALENYATIERRVRFQNLSLLYARRNIFDRLFFSWIFQD